VEGDKTVLIMEQRTYELMFIVDPELGEEATSALLERVQGYIEDNEGEVIGFKDWGLRRLAYPIKRKRQGHYYLTYFSILSNRVQEIERSLLLAEGILREMIVIAEGEIKVDEPAVEEPEAATTATATEEPQEQQTEEPSAAPTEETPE